MPSAVTRVTHTLGLESVGTEELAELQQWAQLVSLAERPILAAGIKVDFFRLLTQGPVCLQGLKFRRVSQ